MRFLDSLRQGATDAAFEAQKLVRVQRQQSAISSLRREREAAILAVGTRTVERGRAGTLEDDELMALVEPVLAVDTRIEDAESELERIQAEEPSREAQPSRPAATDTTGIACANCGADVPQGALYCTSCGTKVEGPSATEQQAGGYAGPPAFTSPPGQAEPTASSGAEAEQPPVAPTSWSGPPRFEPASPSSASPDPDAREAESPADREEDSDSESAMTQPFETTRLEDYRPAPGFTPEPVPIDTSTEPGREATGSVRQCPNCGKGAGEVEVFCTDCGSRLPSPS